MNANSVTLTLNVNVDVNDLARVSEMLRNFIAAVEGPAQKKIVTVNPETGFIPDPSKVVDPEEALKIAYKVNPELSTFDPSLHGKTTKKAHKVSTRAPLTDVEKAIIRIRLLNGKLNHTTDKKAQAELQSKIDGYQAVIDKAAEVGTELVNRLTAEADAKDEKRYGLNKGGKFNRSSKKVSKAQPEPVVEPEVAIDMDKGVLTEIRYADGTKKFTRTHSAGITPGTPESDKLIAQRKAEIKAKAAQKKLDEEKAAVEAYELAQAQAVACKASKKAAKKAAKTAPKTETK
jgi:hypothetical protein